ncbi:MAG: hypothetical protein IT291_07475 [Deltaproteobacteria bacterium]|nr:hypothetical protein [Deltaproteobacteria bacterium]
MNLRVAKLLAVLNIVIFLPLSVFAEDESVSKNFGRLRTGKAYRIDKDGYRITDHLAELEVTVDDLKRQVMSLEDELEEKRQIISSLKASGGKVRSVELEERELKPPRTTKVSNTELPARMSVDCISAISPLQIKIAQLEKQIAERLVIDKNGQKNLSSAEEENIQLRASVKAKDEAVATLQQQLAEAISAVETAQQSIKGLEGNLELANAKIEKQIEKQSMSEAQETVPSPLFSDSQARANLIGDVEPSLAKKPEVRRELPKVEDVSVAKKELGEAFSVVQRLIGKRKDLLDSAKASRRDISIKIASLKTKSGVSLDVLRGQFKVSRDRDELRQIAGGLEQIKDVVSQDILLLTRLVEGRRTSTKVIAR